MTVVFVHVENDIRSFESNNHLSPLLKK